jgi:beta-lactamase regulating signal transducer with metallopeptidase domain
MISLSALAGAWWDWVISASWQIALLVCVVGVLTYLLRDASPRLRYGLWLLVLVKALLPPTLTAFWGVGAWGVAPVASFDWRVVVANAEAGANESEAAPATNDNDAAANDPVGFHFTTTALLVLLWALGCALLWLMVAWRYGRLVRGVRSMRWIDEGPARVELERLAEGFGVRTVPKLYATDRATSPMLMGVVRPKIILPEGVLARLDPEEVRMVLAHELVHWRRRDTWIGWLQVLVQGVFWFHPLVWWANTRLRHERECACDETVLREAACDRDGYGETIVRVVTAARGRSLAMANMVGVFERGSQLQMRLEEIMSFDPKKRRFGWVSKAVVVAAALVLLPMAVPRVAADVAAPAPKVKTNWPVIVSSVPAIGATDVDPNLKEISVTFDRDMSTGGYSWTGGGEFFPPSPEGAMPVWKDKRTCVLPVELKREAFYRVGINSSSFHNFKSEIGTPAETAAVYFATKGANRAVANRVRVPKVVKLVPKNGATDVEPATKMLRVTFDMPMDTTSYSFTGGGPSFPGAPGTKPRWSADGKMCMLPISLAPGRQYELGLNSVTHKNFASKWGVPLAPVRYTFATAGEPEATASATIEGAEESGPPQIVKLTPENGATEVDPSLTELEVTFDRPMAGGFSWAGGGERFPTIPEGQKPSWSADRKTCTLPVVLEPNKQYQLGLNSRSFKNFASAEGVPLEPVVYEFRTSPGN